MSNLILMKDVTGNNSIIEKPINKRCLYISGVVIVFLRHSVSLFMIILDSSALKYTVTLLFKRTLRYRKLNFRGSASMKGSFYYYIAILRSIARIYSQHLHYSNRIFGVKVMQRYVPFRYNIIQEHPLNQHLNLSGFFVYY